MFSGGISNKTSRLYRALVDKEYVVSQRVKEEKVTKEEITRAIKQARALFAYGSENITNQGFWLGYAEMFSEYSWFETYLDRLSAVTVKDVQRVANAYFQPQRRVVGTYIPLDGKGSS
jgi:zinc protease